MVSHEPRSDHPPTRARHLVSRRATSLRSEWSPIGGLARHLPVAARGVVWSACVSEVDHGADGRPIVMPSDSMVAEPAGPSWLVRAVPGLILGSGLIAMAAAMLLAARSGVNAPVSKQVSIGPFDVVVVYSTPTAELVVAALVTALAFVLLVVGLDAWAAKRVTDPARRSRDAVARPLRSEATTHSAVGTSLGDRADPGPQRRAPHRGHARVAASSDRASDGGVGDRRQLHRRDGGGRPRPWCRRLHDGARIVIARRAGSTSSWPGCCPHWARWTPCW